LLFKTAAAAVQLVSNSMSSSCTAVHALQSPTIPSHAGVSAATAAAAQPAAAAAAATPPEVTAAWTLLKEFTRMEIKGTAQQYLGSAAGRATLKDALMVRS
jgi:hypothetical protein